MINLLPWRERLRETRKKQFLMFLGVGVGGVIAMIIFLHVVVQGWIDSQRAVNSTILSEIKKFDQQIIEIDGLKEQKQRLIARMQIIQTLQASRPMTVLLMQNLVKIIPDGVHLLKVQRSGDNIRLEGQAESNTRVSQLMRNIDASKWLKNPSLNEIKTTKVNNEQRISDFQLQMTQKAPELEQEN